MLIKEKFRAFMVRLSSTLSTMVSKGHPLKKLSTTKTKNQNHVELYDISCTKLSSNSR
jgi:hypothetical protein